MAVNDIQDVRPIIKHVTAHPHGVAAAYDELLKSNPGKRGKSLLGTGGGVFSQFVVNQAPQVIAREFEGVVAVVWGVSHKVRRWWSRSKRLPRRRSRSRSV
jgi:hypothetical protein